MIERNNQFYSAQGLQTIFTLRTPESLLQVHRQADDTIDGWDLKKAEKVLRSWQRKFVEVLFFHNTHFLSQCREQLSKKTNLELNAKQNHNHDLESKILEEVQTIRICYFQINLQH